jgi:hypothetical protein
MSPNYNRVNALFPYQKLPLELCYKSLKYASQSRRPIIVLTISRHMVSPSYSPPTVPHLNQESCKETTKWFTKLSLSEPLLPVLPTDTPTNRDVYVELQNDIVYLRFGQAHSLDFYDTRSNIMERNKGPLEEDKCFFVGERATQALVYFVNSISEDQGKEIQHVAIDIERWPGEYGEEMPSVYMAQEFLEVMTQLPNLKTLVVVVGGEERTKAIGDRAFVHATPCSMIERNAVEGYLILIVLFFLPKIRKITKLG